MRRRITCIWPTGGPDWPGMFPKAKSKLTFIRDFFF